MGPGAAMTPIDRIAQTNRWRRRSLLEKSLLALGLLALALALPPGPATLAVAVAAPAAAIFGAGVAPRAFGLALLAPLGFALTGAATLLVAVDGSGLHLAPDGLAAAGALVLRSTAAVSALLLLALTTPATDLVAGLARLGVPRDIVEIALLTYRFLLLLADTALAMDAAQAARLGHDGWRRRIRSAGLVAANLLPRAIDRAQRLEVALAARGWDGGALAVLSPERPVSSKGLAAIAATLLAVAALGLAPPIGGLS